MKKHVAFAAILALAMPLTVSILSALGETRIDVYVSLFTLEYFICTAVLRPRRKTLDFVGLGLLATFVYFVTQRILGILYGV